MFIPWAFATVVFSVASAGQPATIWQTGFEPGEKKGFKCPEGWEIIVEPESNHTLRLRKTDPAQRGTVFSILLPLLKNGQEYQVSFKARVENLEVPPETLNNKKKHFGLSCIEFTENGKGIPDAGKYYYCNFLRKSWKTYFYQFRYAGKGRAWLRLTVSSGYKGDFFYDDIIVKEAKTERSTLSADPGGKTDEWHGYFRHVFEVDGHEAWIVCPEKPLSGNPWVWCFEWPLPFSAREGWEDILDKGYHYVHINVGPKTYGSPQALRSFDHFYDRLVSLGLAKTGIGAALSRGGLYVYRWASKHPERLSAIYCDSPVCDFKSYPGPKHGDWKYILSLYNFKNSEEAMAYKGNPIDAEVLKPLAEHRITLLHLVGDADTTVPPSDNTDILAKRYRELGGDIQVIRVPGRTHNDPGGLEDCAPIVDFILRNTISAGPKKNVEGK